MIYFQETYDDYELTYMALKAAEWNKYIKKYINPFLNF